MKLWASLLKFCSNQIKLVQLSFREMIKKFSYNCDLSLVVLWGNSLCCDWSSPKQSLCPLETKLKSIGPSFIKFEPTPFAYFIGERWIRTQSSSFALKIMHFVIPQILPFLALGRIPILSLIYTSQQPNYSISDASTPLQHCPIKMTCY